MFECLVFSRMIITDVFCSYSVTYVEDSDAIFPLNTSDFSISDDDNNFLLRATLTAGILPVTTLFSTNIEYL